MTPAFKALAIAVSEANHLLHLALEKLHCISINCLLKAVHQTRDQLQQELERLEKGSLIIIYRFYIYLILFPFTL